MTETIEVHEPAPHRHPERQSRLNQAVAWVAIIAGVVFIVGAIFFTGFTLGRHSGGGGHHGGPHFMRLHPAPMGGGPMMPMAPEGPMSPPPGMGPQNPPAPPTGPTARP
ncbi:MAG: hypothetical protein ACR2JM_16455 [Mycobacterium sp.]